MFGKLSDRIGRKPIILAGFVLAVATYQPIFHGLTRSTNPALANAMERSPVVLYTSDYHGRLALAGAAIRDAAHKIVLPSKLVSVTDQARSFISTTAAFRSRSPLPETARRSNFPSAALWSMDSIKRPTRPRLRRLATPPQRIRQRSTGRLRSGCQPVDHLRDLGLRADRRIPGGIISDAHPLQLDVASVPYRQRMVRRLPSAHRRLHCRLHRRHLHAGLWYPITVAALEPSSSA